MKKILLTSLALISVLVLNAQLPGACPGNAISLSNNCASACVACDFTTFTSSNNTSNAGQQVPADFCPGQPIAPHNLQWVGFVAGTPSITMSVQVGPCMNGDGLQLGIWSTPDCNDLNIVSNCAYVVPDGGTATLTANGLTVGGTYFLVVDGASDDVCEFTANITNGSTIAPAISGNPIISLPPGPFCPASVINAGVSGVQFASSYEWTLNGTPTGDFGQNISLSNLSGTPDGTPYELCVTPSNPCQGDGTPGCVTFTVIDPDPEIIEAEICQGEVFVYQGTPLTATGQYPFVQIVAGCEYTTIIDLTVEEAAEGSDEAEICTGDFIVYRGTPLSVAGQYEFILFGQAANGCDSVVTFELTTIDPTQVDLGTITLCDQFLPYEIEDGVTISTPGPFDILVPQPEPDCPILYRGTLVITSNETNFITETICAGEVLTVQGVNFTEQGVDTLSFPEPGGCTIDYIVDLTVYDPSTTLNPTICDGESFTVGTSSFNTTGSYNVTLASTFMGLGCDSIVTLNLTVRDAIETYLDEEICEGETFQTGGQTFAATGMYSVVLEAENGCDSTVFLDLTVHPNVETVLSPVLCFGETFEAGGQTFASTGNYTVDLMTAEGCDSTVTVNLTIKAPIVTELARDICEGESFSVGGMPFDTTGTYEVTLTAADGCDSTVILELQVLDVLETELNEEVCAGGSFTIGSSTYSATGTYVENLTSVTGCDSIVTLNLVVPEPIETFLEEEICDDESVTVGTQSFNQSSTYVVTLQAENGCDSTVTLDLTVFPNIVTLLTPVLCFGEDFEAGGQTFDASGSYTVPLSTADGCDSIVNVELTIKPEIRTVLDEAICQGESFTAAGNVYTETGAYEEILTAADGCDSIVNLNLTVFDVPSVTLNEEVCFGEDFTVGSTTYTETGTYIDTLTAANGCDSIVILNLIVPGPIINDIDRGICTGQSVTIGSSTYSTPGMYTDVLTAANGCDSTVNLTLTVDDVIRDTLVTSICEGETAFIDGTPYTETGFYSQDFVTATDCDSTFYLDLTVFATRITEIDSTICDGESVAIGGNTYTTTGNFEDVFQSVETGCDSIVRLNLSVLPVPRTSLVEDICEFESFSVGTSTYDASGTYVDTLVAANGCDSIVTLELTVLPVPQVTLVEDICEFESFSVGTSTYDASGTYVDTLVAANGCDSIVTLELTVLPVPQVTLTEEICEFESFSVGTSAYNASGTYVDTLVAANGCDSIVTLQLTVFPLGRETLDITVCPGGTVQVGTSTYSIEGTYVDTLTSVATGCDSIVTLNLSERDFFQINLNRTICEFESFTVGTTAYTETGMYSQTFTSQQGCDSIVNLNLTVVPLPRETISPVICEGEAFEIAGSTYSLAGTYLDTLTSSVSGCDSIVTTELTVLPTVFTTLDEEICDYESFTVGTSTYNMQGTFVDTLSSVVTGCDSIVTLNLNINPTLRTTLTEEICDYESFTVGSSTYNTQGTFMDTLSSVVTGCDSIVTLNLSINPTLRTTLTEVICSGDSFGVGSSTYSTSGTFMDTLSSAITGCDSIITLNLTVREQIRTTLNEEICESGSFTVGSSTYTEAGTHIDTLTALASGCDSIVTLNLTVNPEYAVSLQQDICDDESFTVGDESFSQAGTYTVVLETVAGCDSIVTLELAVYPCELQFASQATDVRCHGDADGQASFELLVGTPPYTYTWQAVPGGAPNGAGTVAGNNISEVLDQLPVGTFRIDVTDSSPFAITGSTTVTIAQPAPIDIEMLLSEYNAFNLSCQGETDGAIEGIVTGGIPPYNYSWSNGSRLEEIDQLSAGVYSLTVTDANGCSQEATATLVEPVGLTVELNAINPACAGENAGRIIIDAVSGGVSPYLYGIDGAPLSSQSQFANLSIGTHLIEVQDANGCSATQQVVIEAPQELTVDLGPDQEVKLGESLNLLPQTSYAVSQYLWDISPDASPTCLDCPNPMISPVESMALSVTVTDENDCQASDRINIFVNKQRDVYIPNAFSPNGDGRNDLFTVFTGPDALEVRSFRVYNRWGETLYEANGFVPNSPSIGWDGTHRGEMMNAGVFIYTAEVEFLDGAVILFKGDVVLLR